MSEKTQPTAAGKKNKAAARRSVPQAPAALPGVIPAAHPAALVQRAEADPRLLRSPDVLRLQQAVGNRAVNRLLAARASTPIRPIQTKLVVGAAHDPYEQEADRVADQVLRGPTPAPLQRQLPDDAAAPRVQRAPAGLAGSFEPGADFESKLAAGAGGRPLPRSTQAFMESRFGADFSSVRLHTGSRPAELNRSIGARAFTHGADIYLGEGQEVGGSSAGQQLLAHELTHVVQQGAAPQLAQRKAAPAPARAQTTPDPGTAAGDLTGPVRLAAPAAVQRAVKAGLKSGTQVWDNTRGAYRYIVGADKHGTGYYVAKLITTPKKKATFRTLGELDMEAPDSDSNLSEDNDFQDPPSFLKKTPVVSSLIPEKKTANTNLFSPPVGEKSHPKVIVIDDDFDEVVPEKVPSTPSKQQGEITSNAPTFKLKPLNTNLSNPRDSEIKVDKTDLILNNDIFMPPKKSSTTPNRKIKKPTKKSSKLSDDLGGWESDVDRSSTFESKKPPKGSQKEEDNPFESPKRKRSEKPGSLLDSSNETEKKKPKKNEQKVVPKKPVKSGVKKTLTELPEKGTWKITLNEEKDATLSDDDSTYLKFLNTSYKDARTNTKEAGKKKGNTYTHSYKGVTINLRLDKIQKTPKDKAKYYPRIGFPGYPDPKTKELAALIEGFKGADQTAFIAGVKGEDLVTEESKSKTKTGSTQARRTGLGVRALLLGSDYLDHSDNVTITLRLLSKCTADNYKHLFRGGGKEQSYGAMPSQNTNTALEGQQDRIKVYNNFGTLIKDKELSLKLGNVTDLPTLRKLSVLSDYDPSLFTVSEDGNQVDPETFKTVVHTKFSKRRSTEAQSKLPGYTVLSQDEASSEEEQTNQQLIEEERQRKIEERKEAIRKAARSIRLLGGTDEDLNELISSINAERIKLNKNTVTKK